MKWLPLLWAALRRKPGRSIFTLLSIMVAFLLVGSMTGLNATFAKAIEDARADRIGVFPSYGAWFPLTHFDQIAQLDDVTDLFSWAWIESTFQEPANTIWIRMTDSRMADVEPESGVTPEMFAAMERVRDGLIVSEVDAERFGWSVGDQIPLQTDRVNQDDTRDWTFQIAAIVPESDEFGSGYAIGNFTYLNEFRGDGRYNDIHGINLLIEDGERADEVADSIEDLFANSSFPMLATPQRTAIRNNLQAVLDIQFITYAVSAASLFMLLFLTGNVMARSVHERVAEFAVMKTVGFSDKSVFALVIAETALLCLVGAGLGLLMANFMPGIARGIVQNMPIPTITYGVVAISFACAAIVAVISGLPAAWRVKNLTIAEALAGR